MLLITSSLAFGASVWRMSERLEAYRATDPVELHYFIQVESASFDYLGATVRIDTVDRNGRAMVAAAFGNVTEYLSVLGKDIPGLGPLDRHRDWLRLLLLAGTGGEFADPAELLARGGEGSKLVLVARGGAPGLDPGTWGSAHYKDWVYDFIVFEPTGNLTRFSRTYRELSQIQHSWEFAAAMNVTPSLHTPAMRSSSPISYPNYGPVRNALNSMGWTWPVAGVSVLAGTAGLMLFGASFVKSGSRDDPSEQAS